MRNCTIIIALIAATAGGVGMVAAGPGGQKPSETNGADTQSEERPDFHFTMSAGRGRLGFAAIQISPELRKHLGAPAERGVLVDQIRANSPAERAGLRVGDVITEVDGAACKSASDVIEAISDREKGDTVKIAVSRAGQRLELEATLEEDPGFAWRDFRRFDDKDMFDGFGDKPFGMMFESEELRRALEDARKRIQELERRVDKLGSKRT